ncbi:Carboxypeptidase S [Tetrabaena socialis]|uniref:Carboxypeptidase S n=1 Tax=Tetrabaena socialis TaxID=47790 RepID=A0A2J7ZVW6_9CHLO|nr:Carboxypeptidase S [Tetrabaena socialis]|eukprot:PNH04406.1 Carboxypeptidase S [Tetrabaena socialis]
MVTVTSPRPQCWTWTILSYATRPQVLLALLSDLERSYPLVWKSMNVERVGAGNFSLLLTWAGSDPSLPATLFVSHYDVVPVSPGTEGQWKHPPFGAEIADG